MDAVQLTQSYIIGGTPIILRRVDSGDNWRDVSAYLPNPLSKPLAFWIALYGTDTVTFV